MKNILLVKIVFLVLMVVAVAPVWANFLAGEDAYLREDYERALEEWRPLAKRGNVEAQNSVRQNAPQSDKALDEHTKSNPTRVSRRRATGL